MICSLFSSSIFAVAAGAAEKLRQKSGKIIFSETKKMHAGDSTDFHFFQICIKKQQQFLGKEKTI